MLPHTLSCSFRYPFFTPPSSILCVSALQMDSSFEEKLSGFSLSWILLFFFLSQSCHLRNLSDSCLEMLVLPSAAPPSPCDPSSGPPILSSGQHDLPSFFCPTRPLKSPNVLSRLLRLNLLLRGTLFLPSFLLPGGGCGHSSGLFFLWFYPCMAHSSPGCASERTTSSSPDDQTLLKTASSGSFNVSFRSLFFVCFPPFLCSLETLRP